MRGSPRHTLGAGVVLILAVNALALGGVAYNRGGEPDSLLRLTERELRRPPRDWGFEQESSGLALKLHWRVRTEDPGDPAWLTAAKLAELGVDVSGPLDTERGKRRYEKLPAKAVFLVLELDGENHRAALELAQARAARERAAALANPGDAKLKSRSEYAERQLEHEEKTASRLFVVDAGGDAQALRARYPERSRHAIVRGRIEVGVTGEGRQARLRGHIEGLDIDQIHVPHGLRPVFEDLPVRYEHEARTQRFEALVAYGRRLEPWLASARKL